MSLRTLTRAMQLYLQNRGCPLPVEYGPMREADFNLRQRIVFERDRSGGDQFVGPRARGISPVQQVQRVGCFCTIVGKSSAAGADMASHEAVCDQAASLVALGLRECLQSEPCEFPWMGMCGPTLWEITRAGLLAPSAMPPLRDIQWWSAAVYQIAFWFDVGIAEQNWQGEGPQIASVGSFSTILQSLGVGIKQALPRALVRVFNA